MPFRRIAILLLLFASQSIYGATIDIFAGSLLKSRGGRASAVDQNREVHTLLTEKDQQSFGIRFGFPVSKYVALELTLKGFTNDYSIDVFDRRLSNDPYSSDLATISNTEIPATFFDFRYEPFPARVSPYLSAGVGYLGLDPDDNTSSWGFNVASGLIAYPVRLVGFRVDFRFTVSSVDGLVAQSSPPRMLAYRDKIRITEISAGVIFNIVRRQ